MTFAKLHDPVRQDKRLPASAKIVYAAISRRCLNKEVCELTQVEIAAEVGLSPRQVRRLEKDMESSGYLYIEHRGAGRGKGRQGSLYYVGNLAAEKWRIETMAMSASKVRKVTSVSASKVRKVTSVSASKQLENGDKIPAYNSLSEKNEKLPLKNPPQRESLNSNDVLRGESRGGGTNELDKIAAAKFKKLIGRDSDNGFGRFQPELLIDTLDLLQFKIDRGADIIDRAGWLMEALRSNYVGQKKIRGFKTSRQTVREEKHRTENRAKEEVENTQIDRLNSQVNSLLERFSDDNWRLLREKAASYMLSQNIAIPCRPSMARSVVNIFIRGQVAKIIRDNGNGSGIPDSKLGEFGPVLDECVREALPEPDG